MAPLPPAPVKANCPNCGVIETVREVEKAGKYQTAVRFENRYTQVFTSSSVPSWRIGDNVKVVNGVIEPNGYGMLGGAWST